MCLVGPADLDAGSAQMIEETGGQQGVWSSAKSFAMFVVAVGNGHQIDPHG
jgi:hypothetical protein